MQQAAAGGSSSSSSSSSLLAAATSIEEWQASAQARSAQGSSYTNTRSISDIVASCSRCGQLLLYYYPLCRQYPCCFVTLPESQAKAHS